MYRLIGPKIIFFIPIVLIGIVVVALTPNYFGVTRTLSLSALLLGQSGLSLIPILALYPKASPAQAAILGAVYFFTTFIICFAVSGINNLGWPGNFAFEIVYGEFAINTYALYAANFFSLAALFLSFRLLYDEELARQAHKKKQQAVQQGFIQFQKPSFKSQEPPLEQKRPDVQKKIETFKKGGNITDDFEDDYLKPFEFEPEIRTIEESLPAESTGKLFSPKINIKSNPGSEFFEDEESAEGDFSRGTVGSPLSQGSGAKPRSLSDFFDDIEPSDDKSVKPQKLSPPKNPEAKKEEPKPSKPSPFPPSNIKDDLQAIFEQYSSLNAVKKLTASKADKISQKKKIQDKTSNKSFTHSKDTPKISVKIEGEDIHEATYRSITEEEKLQEIKEELKKELTSKSQDTKETKEEIIQSIKNIKEEVIESLKEEFKKELTEKENNEIPFSSKDNEQTEENNENEVLQETLTKINSRLKNSGAVFLNNKGVILAENWGEKQVLHEDVDSTIIQVYNSINSQINKTNQGSLLHILLESDNGTLALAEIENKILTVYTSGTGEANSGQILRTLSEIEES